jgi:hypothetical protein
VLDDFGYLADLRAGPPDIRRIESSQGAQDLHVDQSAPLPLCRGREIEGGLLAEAPGDLQGRQRRTGGLLGLRILATLGLPEDLRGTCGERRNAQ